MRAARGGHGGQLAAEESGCCLVRGAGATKSPHQPWRLAQCRAWAQRVWWRCTRCEGGSGGTSNAAKGARLTTAAAFKPKLRAEPAHNLNPLAAQPQAEHQGRPAAQAGFPGGRGRRSDGCGWRGASASRAARGHWLRGSCQGAAASSQVCKRRLRRAGGPHGEGCALLEADRDVPPAVVGIRGNRAWGNRGSANLAGCSAGSGQLMLRSRDAGRRLSGERRASGVARR